LLGFELDQCFQFPLLIPDADIDTFALLKQSLFCLMKQNKHSSNHFAFSQTWLVELVIWHVGTHDLLSWLWCL